MEISVNNQFCSSCGTSIFVKKKELILLCRICHANFKNKTKLKKHLNSHPKCAICQEHVKDVKKHIALYHPKCEFCGKQFNTKLKLNEHIKLTHLCPLCGQGFKTREERSRHYKSHPKCEICGALLETPKNLEIHVLHHPKCNVCGKRFNNEHTLVKHFAEVHINPRVVDISCKCGYSFQKEFGKKVVEMIFDCPRCNNRLKIRRPIT